MCFRHLNQLKQTLFMVGNTSSTKILVTGANGQLGAELQAMHLAYPQLQFVFTDFDELDITDCNAVSVFIAKHQPSFIVNCAAYTAVDKAEEEPDKAYELNALAPKYLAEAAKNINAKLIHISTDYVFDGNACEPYAENFITSPNSVYGSTKLKGEEFALSTGVAMVIRTAWLYSSYGKNFVKTIAGLAKDKHELKVVYDQIGSPTWAYDLAQAILQIVLQGVGNFKPEVFHFSNEGVCSWYDLAVEIVSYLGYSCQIIPILSAQYPTLAKRPHYSVLNKLKVKSSYNVSVPHWRKSLIKCLDLLST